MDSRFAFLQKFPRINMEKLKAGIFDGLQIREHMNFDKALNEVELSVWQLLKSVVINFLGNHRSAEYEKEIEELLKSPHPTQLRARMSVKLRFLRSYLDYFPKNCGDIRIMEERYQSELDVKLLLCIFQFTMPQFELFANISALNFALFV